MSTMRQLKCIADLTDPNVPSPSFSKNSKSLIFEQPRKRGWPSSYRSRDGRCDDGDDSEAIFALDDISNRKSNRCESRASDEEMTGAFVVQSKHKDAEDVG